MDHPALPTDPAAALPRPDVVDIPLTAPQACEVTAAHVWPGGDPGAAAVILAHGAGTDMRHPVVRRHAEDLRRAGHPVAVFDFAYSHLGRGRPDPGPRLESAWRDVIAALHPVLGADRPLVIGGRSMGGRIASMVAAAGAPVDGVICLAYPLHPPGRPDRLRVAHWPDLAVPVLLLSGSRDSMAPLEALRANLDAHMPAGLAELHVLQGADHSFAVRKKDGRTQDEVMSEAAAVMAAWLARVDFRRPDGG